MGNIISRLAEKSKPDQYTGCTHWVGNALPRGYGRIVVHGKRYLAHRLSYEVHVGPIPDGMNVLHKCDVPACINPDHLYLGTQRENVRDMMERGRAKGQWTRQNAPAFRGVGGRKPVIPDEIVREIRAARGVVSASDLSRMYGISPSYVSKLQRLKKRRSLT